MLDRTFSEPKEQEDAGSRGSVPRKLRQRLERFPPGAVFTPREFSREALGSYSAIRQAFVRLARSGDIVRVRNGYYTHKPSPHGGTPSDEAFARALHFKVARRLALFSKSPACDQADDRDESASNQITAALDGACCAPR